MREPYKYLQPLMIKMPKIIPRNQFKDITSFQFYVIYIKKTLIRLIRTYHNDFMKLHLNFIDSKDLLF